MKLRAAKLRKFGFSAVSSCRREPDYFFSILFPLRVARRKPWPPNKSTNKKVRCLRRRRQKIREKLIQASLGCSIVHSSHTMAVYTTHFRWIISTQKIFKRLPCMNQQLPDDSYRNLFKITNSLASFLNLFSCLSLSVVTLNAWTRNSIVYKTRHNTEIKQSLIDRVVACVCREKFQRIIYTKLIKMRSFVSSKWKIQWESELSTRTFQITIALLAAMAASATAFGYGLLGGSQYGSQYGGGGYGSPYGGGQYGKEKNQWRSVIKNLKLVKKLKTEKMAKVCKKWQSLLNCAEHCCDFNC